MHIQILSPFIKTSFNLSKENEFIVNPTLYNIKNQVKTDTIQHLFQPDH